MEAETTKPRSIEQGFVDMAQRTGLEPATPGVTGRYSNRLNYRCMSVGKMPEQLFFQQLKPLNTTQKRCVKNGAADGTRTRDPRRDRPVF